MTVRTPLYWDGTQLKEMSAAMITIIKNRAIAQYAADPAVTLSVVATNGSLPSMIDRRYQAGAASTDATDYDTEAETDDISAVDTTYDKIDQTTGTQTQPADTNNIAFPIYQSSGNIYAMTYADFQDTFIKPAIDTIAGSYVNANQAGTYYVSTSNSVAGMTLVSTTPIFVDTRADAAAYTDDGIAETQDQPTTINSYYLHQIDSSQPSYTQVPMYVRNTNYDLQTYTDANFDTLLQNAMRHTTINTVGYRLSYTIGGTAGAGESNRGGIADTYLSGTSADGYTTYFGGADDYRSQEFPNGTPATRQTYYFKIVQS